MYIHLIVFLISAFGAACSDLGSIIEIQFTDTASKLLNASHSPDDKKKEESDMERLSS